MTRWLRADVAWVEGDDHVVVLPLRDALVSPVHLDATGSAIWRAVPGIPSTGADTHAVVAALTEVFEARAEDILDDVEQFLQHLADTGLVTAASAPERAG